MPEQETWKENFDSKFDLLLDGSDYDCGEDQKKDVKDFIHETIAEAVSEERHRAMEEILDAVTPEQATERKTIDTGFFIVESFDEKATWNACRSEVIQKGGKFISRL